MSKRGDVIRAAGGLLKRNNKLGVGQGHPAGGDEGDIRINMVDGSPRLYAKAGGQWYGTGLETSVTKEFTIGKVRDHVKITPDGVSIIGKHKKVFDLDSNKATLTLDQSATTSDDEAGIIMINDGAGENRIILDGANPEMWMGYASTAGGSPTPSISGSSKIYMRHGDDANNLAVIDFSKQGDAGNRFGFGLANEELRISIGSSDLRDSNIANVPFRLQANGNILLGYDASNYATLSIADDGHFEIATTGNTNSDITLDAAGAINIEPGRTVYIKKSGTSVGYIFIDLLSHPLVEIRSLADADDKFTMQVNAAGATTLATVDDAGAAAHLSIEADGHVEFDGCAVGFDQEEETFSDDTLKGTGGTHDTQVDFRIGNKIYLQFTASMDQINLIFPAVSGNFLLLARYDGDWSIGDWKVWESDLTAATTNDVAWAGGTQPDHTDSGRDIYSFYWDADNQTCYGVASLAFAMP